MDTRATDAAYVTEVILDASATLLQATMEADGCSSGSSFAQSIVRLVSDRSPYGRCNPVQAIPPSQQVLPGEGIKLMALIRTDQRTFVDVLAIIPHPTSPRDLVHVPV